MANELLFYFVAAVVLASAAGVVLLKNVVHAAFLLVLTFAGVGGVYMLLQADFVALAQILIYVGAIVIMLLFALMLTQRKDTSSEPPSENRAFWASLTALLLFVILYRAIATSPWGQQVQQAVLTPRTLIDAGNNLQLPLSGGTAAVLGNGFFGSFLLPFEVASVVLLMALIGAIVIAYRDPKTD